MGMALIALAAPAAADDMPATPPTAQANIIAGARACYGATSDAPADPARFAGWEVVAPERRRQMHADGNVVTRGDVMIAYQLGRDGGCVVIARGDTAFDAATFYPQLSAVVGVTVAQGAQPGPVDLPDGELVIPVLSPPIPPAGPSIVLVFANRAGKHVTEGH